jgi:hypothetical protein
VKGGSCTRRHAPRIAVRLASMPATSVAQPTKYRVSAPSPHPTLRMDVQGL